VGELRVRFAPSPTGYLHIGGARTALFNYLFAKHNGGKFVLRIEDTDVERTIEDSAERMMESFKWLGLEWDEGPIVGGPAAPYQQSQRRELYKKYAQTLMDKGLAYKCYCTPEELAAEREEARRAKKAPRYSGRCRNLTEEQIRKFEAEGRKYAIRFRTPDGGYTVVNDLIHGEVSFPNDEIADFIIMKSDGLPTYNFACVIDDWLMGITHVIRADEHLSNTPRQMMLYRALGAPLPKFAHVPMILAPDRSKLSKRHGAQTVEEFRDKGYLPEAIVNYIALLGWTPPDATQEFMTLEEMIELFDLSRVSSTAAVYDVQKLTWMNGQYIKRLDPEDLMERVIPFVEAAGLATRQELEARKDWFRQAVITMQERAKTLEELAHYMAFYFKPPETYDEKGVNKHFAKPGVAGLLEKCVEVLSRMPEWTIEACDQAYTELAEKEGVSRGKLIHPTRLALSGITFGPGLFDIMFVLGKDETVSRLKAAIKFIKEACE
jgi:glutamyl-tRNA synthetase